MNCAKQRRFFVEQNTPKREPHILEHHVINIRLIHNIKRKEMGRKSERKSKQYSLPLRNEIHRERIARFKFKHENEMYACSLTLLLFPFISIRFGINDQYTMHTRSRKLQLVIKHVEM